MGGTGTGSGVITEHGAQPQHDADPAPDDPSEDPSRSAPAPGRQQPPPPDASEPDDRDLARWAALGDRAAFGTIVDRHGPAMFRYALRMADGDAAAAEDAVQEALAQAWFGLPRFRGDAALRTWLFTITGNAVLRARRRRRPISVDDRLLNTVPAPAQRDPYRQVEAQELHRALVVALAELPWRQRASWLLRESEGLSYEEIADVLGTTTTVVRGQLHRARATLAVRMASWR